MIEKPRNKRQQTDIDRNYGGDYEKYKEGMRARASKGGQAKVPKGWAITKRREVPVEDR